MHRRRRAHLDDVPSSSEQLKLPELLLLLLLLYPLVPEGGEPLVVTADGVGRGGIRDERRGGDDSPHDGRVED